MSVFIIIICAEGETFKICDFHDVFAERVCGMQYSIHTQIIMINTDRHNIISYIHHISALSMQWLCLNITTNCGNRAQHQFSFNFSSSRFLWAFSTNVLGTQLKLCVDWIRALFSLICKSAFDIGRTLLYQLNFIRV